MPPRVLITGGAGFIGRHVTAALLARGCSVRVLDCFVEQVHGADPVIDPVLRDVEICRGNVCDGDAVAAALRGVDAVIHLAAEVGVGQSMYEIGRYVNASELGTAVLFQELIANPVRRIVTASSMSVYGEGLYRNAAGELVESARRRFNGRAEWDPQDDDGLPLEPLPTPEWKRPNLSSVYALNKFAQEQMTMIVAPAYGMEPAALRLFNVYGPGQSLSNPYTGVLAIFAARIKNGEAPLVFEDGLQRRDFVHVSDVAEAFCLAVETPGAAGEIINIGSGVDVSIVEVAERMATALGRPDLEPSITGRGRTGDIRHCFADISRARAVLDFEPRRRFDDGLVQLSQWAGTQTAIDRLAEAGRELEQRGLVQ